ncbi:hypothetical protein [Kitasatospora sp. A2-31]|uniref:hypothetical protein n=1 Tax=Kitasatospora sp. A2-31 TaxID=2916414 RepID=UPI001EECB64A|nr:hypothetical protein [Kitasatospora sp. A2-31]MCG6497962.1 hypothetical protein [Kitasatospora sp. A2-31]
MRARIAALMVAAAGITAATIAPASAAVASAETGAAACAAVVDRPCVWQEKDGGGVVGVAQFSAADPGQLTMVQVEVRTQKAWGSPWITTASATTITTGLVKAVTPRVSTHDLKMICATGGPALDATQRVTTCTGPF